MEDAGRRAPARPLPRRSRRGAAHRRLDARTARRRARSCRSVQPDLAIARCKVILKREIFEIPRVGTFVMHPGICPEYRNAHGCFWALVNRDLDRVGMTLLRVDAGIDTGPVYLHGTCDIDEVREIAHGHSAPRGDREPRRDRPHPARALPRRAGADHQHRRTPLGDVGPAAPDRVSAMEMGRRVRFAEPGLRT